MRDRVALGVAALLALAFALRIGFALVHDRPLRSDELDFERLGWTLAQTGSYAENGHPTAYRPVGYPAFVGATYRLSGRHPFAVRAVQALVDTGTVALLFLLGSRRRRSAGWIAAWAWALFPPAVLYANLLIPETLFTFLTFGFVALFDLGVDRRSWGAAFHGAFLGVLILIKPAMTAFLVFAPAVWARLGLRWRDAGLLACGVLLVLAPWVARDMRAVGAASITTSLGPNLLIGNHPGASGGYAPDVPPNMLPRRGSERDEDAASRGIAVRYITRHPGAFFGSGFRKLAYLASGEGEVVVYSLHDGPADSRTPFREKYRAIPATVHLAVSLPYALIVLTAVLGLAARGRDALGTAFLALLASWLCVHFVFFGGGRFHFPLMPTFTLFAGELVSGGWGPIRNLRAGRWAVVLSAWAALALVWVCEVLTIVRA